MTTVRIPWSSSAFLLYVGGLTVFVAASGLLGTLGDDHRAGAFTGLALLVFLVAAVLAVGARAAGRDVVAGLLSLTAVLSFVVTVGALLHWFGWLSGAHSAFGGFHLGKLILELVAVVAPLVALSVFRFPLLVLFATAAAWFFVTDLISGGGTWSTWVTLVFGLTLVVVGLIGGPVYGFWVHVAAGLTAGGALLVFWHHGDVRWILLG